MRGLIFLLGFSLFVSSVYAETIYHPISKVPVYEYKGDLTKGIIFKSSDFSCIQEDCWPIRMGNPFYNSVPLDGFDFYCWERGWNFPKKVVKIYTFLVKQGESFVWKPYSLSDIKNILGD